MKCDIKLSDNLTFTFIAENYAEGDTLKTVVCYFDFFGKECLAYIATNALQSTYPRYTMLDSTSELHESFSDLLEDIDNWKKIIEQVKKFWEEWKLANLEED